MRRVLIFLLLAILPALVGGRALAAENDGLHDRPMLVLDPGAHTAPIMQLDADRKGRFLVTASEDKTVRVWSVENGRLLRTIRLPAGPGDVGEAYAAAISPDGVLVAVGGWTLPGDHDVYLFDRASGRLLRRVGGLPAPVLDLAFSSNGTWLAAALSERGVRLIDPVAGRVVAVDEDYDDRGGSLAFDAAGRLATTSYDGKVRLYDQGLRPLHVVEASGGRQPYGIAFSPDGQKLAVGYDDTTVVDVLDGETLERLFAADTADVYNGNLGSVAWSADGGSLYAVGTWGDIRGDETWLRRWPEGGRGVPENRPLGTTDALIGLHPLPSGGLAFAAQDPRLGVLGPDGRMTWTADPATNAFHGQRDVLAVSADGARVAFRSDRWDAIRRAWARQPILFSLPDRRLAQEEATADLATARTAEMATALGYVFLPVALERHEIPRSLAFAPDWERFALGADWSLRLFNRAGRELWQRPTPSVTWAVNVIGNGRLVVAAYGDGTIRWHKLEDGEELLAFYLHPDRERWVLWTPKGYYDAAAGAEDLIGWQVNRGRDKAAEFYPASRFRDRFHRPDVIDLVLRTLDVGAAVATADARAGRRHETPAEAAAAVAATTPPTVAILESGDPARPDGDIVRLRYIVGARPGDRIRQVRILIDGRDALMQPGFEVPGEGAIERRVAVTLEGRAERLAVIAEDERGGSSEPATIQLARTAAEPGRKPNLWVLAVGVSTYANHPNLKLNYASKDAEEFVAALEHQEGGVLYERVEAQLLRDAAAGGDAVMAGLRWLEERVEFGDVAAMFFSGHGTNDRRGDLVLLPADAEVSTDRGLRRTGLFYADLEPTLVQLAGRAKTVVFLDACYAGNVKGAAADVGRVIADLAAEENGVIVFASTGSKQLSEEYEAGENGAFTEALLEGFAGPADYDRDRVLRFSELHRFVRQRVMEITDKRQRPEAVVPEKRLGDPPLLVLAP